MPPCKNVCPSKSDLVASDVHQFVSQLSRCLKSRQLALMEHMEGVTCDVFQ